MQYNSLSEEWIPGSPETDRKYATQNTLPSKLNLNQDDTNSERQNTTNEDSSPKHFEKWDTEMHRYHFKGRIFIMFFVFYMFYFIGLGPVILLSKLVSGNILLYNLAEITSKGKRVFKIILNWVIPLLYAAFFTGRLVFQYAEIHMLSATLVFIAVSQATMVAYTYDTIEEDLSKGRIPNAQLVRLTTLGSHTIREELKNVALRLNIDLPILYFNFLSDKPGKPSIMRRTTDNQNDLNFEGRERSISNENSVVVHHPQNPAKFKLNLYDYTKSYGENLLFHLLEDLKFPSVTNKIIGWSIFQSLIPVGYQILASRPSTSNYSEFVWFIILILAFWIVNFVCAYFVMEILMITLVNLNRRIRLMKEMQDLIAPYHRKRDGSIKTYHLDFLDSMSLRTWIKVRKILMHYGNREMKTTAISITLVMGFHLIMVILTILHYLGVINLNSSFYEYAVIFGLGSLVYFVLLIQLIWKGASLNNQYNKHREILHADKSIATSLIRLYPSFLADQPLKPQTYIYREGLQKLKEEFGRHSTPDQREEKLHVLLETYNNMLEELNFEEINHPFRLMGVPMTSTLTNSLLAGLFSLIIAVTPKLLSAI